LIKFHGTYTANIDGIKNNGFQIPTSFSRDSDSEEELTFGKAVYFSTYASKVVTYGDGVIFACNIVLGRVRIMKGSGVRGWF